MEVSTKKPIRILCLEDNENDRELLERILSSDGLVCDFVHAKSRQEFEAALVPGAFDLIISDFNLPAYDGMTALATVRQGDMLTPFIFVSGTIGEERAVESLKCGATDYVLKDRRERLVSAVRRALRESQDRAERKQLEDQLRQAQKMEAIGQLAGGVAHDFNNLLAVIRLNAELALVNAPELDSGTRENLTHITVAAEQAANLTRQLLAFSRKQAMRPQPVNLFEVITNLTKMVKRIIGENICMECFEGRHAPFVEADVSMIEQVLLNLVINARDAMDKGGDLIISTKRVRVELEHLPTNEDVKPGAYICLRVRDTGCGIPNEILHRIFEPFFTTKEAGKGTGLGLATVYGIVKQHGGWIRVSSRIGVGTVFRIFLPAIEIPDAPPTAVHSESGRWRGRETVLLVEDDEPVRLTTRRLLEAFGYQVVEAASADEARIIWNARENPVDLLLTDVVMPGGMTGRELADELRKLSPRLKVIFISGYNLSVVSDDTGFLRRENNYFVQKPFKSLLLVETIRRCLDEKRPAAAQN